MSFIGFIEFCRYKPPVDSSLTAWRRHFESRM